MDNGTRIPINKQSHIVMMVHVNKNQKEFASLKYEKKIASVENIIDIPLLWKCFN